MLNAVVESRCGVTGFVRVHKVLMGLCLCYLSTDKAVDCGSMLAVRILCPLHLFGNLKQQSKFVLGI